jgi:hypothetical protein
MTSGDRLCSARAGDGRWMSEKAPVEGRRSGLEAVVVFDEAAVAERPHDMVEIDRKGDRGGCRQRERQRWICTLGRGRTGREREARRGRASIEALPDLRGARSRRGTGLRPGETPRGLQRSRSWRIAVKRGSTRDPRSLSGRETGEQEGIEIGNLAANRVRVSRVGCRSRRDASFSRARRSTGDLRGEHVKSRAERDSSKRPTSR